MCDSGSHLNGTGNDVIRALGLAEIHDNGLKWKLRRCA